VKGLGGLAVYLLWIYVMLRPVLGFLLMPLRGSLRLARNCECSAIDPYRGNPSKLWHRVGARQVRFAKFGYVGWGNRKERELLGVIAYTICSRGSDFSQF